LKATAVTPVKFVPLIVTDVPTAPEPGENDATVGQEVVATEKSPELVAVPFDCVTPIGPVVALAGTVAVIWLDEFCAKVAPWPLKVTAVTPLKPDPEMMT
jgi:hypothetical protein